MNVKCVSIKDEKNNGSILYLQDYHTFVRTEDAQEELIKEIELDLDLPTGIIPPEKLEEIYLDIERRELSRPPAIGFCVITNDCNMECSFCYANKNSDCSRSSFDVEWIKTLKAKMPGESFQKVTISGGEPLLYVDKIQKIRDEFEEAVVYTNGSLIDESFAAWCVETKTNIYVALDYSIEGFDGHRADEIRKKISDLSNKIDGFKDLIEIAITFPSGKIGDLENLRDSQNCGFEDGVKHDFNFVDDKSRSSDQDFIDEVERIKIGKIKLQSSIFTKPLKYIQEASKNVFNVTSCSPGIHLNFLGDIGLCQVRISNTSRPDYREDVISSIADFSAEKYYQKVFETKFKGLCKENCPAKWICGNLCWANIEINKHNCDIARKSIFYLLYILINFSDMEIIENMNQKRIKLVK